MFIVIRLPSRSDTLSVLEPELRINNLVWLRDNASCQATVSPALKFLDSHALTNVGICPRKSNHSQRLPSSGHLLDLWRKHWNIYFTTGNLHNGMEKKTGSPVGFLLIFAENHPPTALGGTLLPEDVEKASPAQGAAKLGWVAHIGGWSSIH